MAKRTNKQKIERQKAKWDNKKENPMFLRWKQPFIVFALMCMCCGCWGSFKLAAIHFDPVIFYFLSNSFLLFLRNNKSSALRSIPCSILIPFHLLYMLYEWAYVCVCVCVRKMLFIIYEYKYRQIAKDLILLTNCEPNDIVWKEWTKKNRRRITKDRRWREEKKKIMADEVKQSKNGLRWQTISKWNNECNKWKRISDFYDTL